MSPLPALYGELAEWWPLLSSPQEYVVEAANYYEVMNAHARRPIERVLELGSGGGNNASHLKRHWVMTLVDLSPDMVAISQALNPECRHLVGDMRDVRVGERFDAVFVHDAVEYLTTEADLRLMAETAFAHCEPGGLVLVSPDGTTETFVEATTHGGGDAPDGRALRYLEVLWDPDPTDTEVIGDYAILLRELDGSARVIHDRHHCGLFPSATWLDVLEGAGFAASSVVEPDTVDWEPREIFLGLRPEAS